jgi:hypothetical protein
MVTRKSALMACGAAVLSLVVAASGPTVVQASRTNHLTFSGAVGLPGVTLARGTYTFETLDQHPDIVRVMSRDGSQIYFTGFTSMVPRPARLRADRPVTLLETPEGVAPRIGVWYPIGGSTGRAFTYPDATR